MSSPNLAPAWNAFGLRLLRHWAQTEPAKNLVFSPASVLAALLMAWSGARQQTAAELGAVLGLGMMDSETALTAGAALLRLSQTEPQVTLHSANGLWTAADLMPEFVARCQHSLGAGLERMGEPSETAERINAWVSEQTRGKIGDLLQAADLAGALLVLVNALYFKGQWQRPFDPQSTVPGNFHPLDGEPQPVSFMQRKGRISVLENDHCQAVALPYGSGRFRMELFLPRQGSPANVFEQPLPVFAARSVQLRLPRFALESRLDLIPALQASGIASAFGEDADFSGMATGGLFIHRALHKARLEVNEQGSEAAAATALAMPRGARPAKTLELTFDRPFACLLRDTSSDLVLFQALIFDLAE